MINIIYLLQIFVGGHARRRALILVHVGVRRQYIIRDRLNVFYFMAENGANILPS